MNKDRLAAGRHLSPDRSHLSPDGGGFLLRRPPLGSEWLRVAVAVATCRQTVEVFPTEVCEVERI